MRMGMDGNLIANPANQPISKRPISEYTKHARPLANIQKQKQKLSKVNQKNLNLINYEKITVVEDGNFFGQI